MLLSANTVRNTLEVVLRAALDALLELRKLRRERRTRPSRLKRRLDAVVEILHRASWLKVETDPARPIGGLGKVFLPASSALASGRPSRAARVKDQSRANLAMT